MTYYKKNKDAILNRTKTYYHNNINFSRERARNKYRELPEEEKIKKKENMQKIDIKTYLKKKKQNLNEYQKKYQKYYREAKKQNSI